LVSVMWATLDGCSCFRVVLGAAAGIARVALLSIHGRDKPTAACHTSYPSIHPSIETSTAVCLSAGARARCERARRRCCQRRQCAVCRGGAGRGQTDRAAPSGRSGRSVHCRCALDGAGPRPLAWPSAFSYLNSVKRCEGVIPVCLCFGWYRTSAFGLAISLFLSEFSDKV
jgi:hypothetical protein